MKNLPHISLNEMKSFNDIEERLRSIQKQRSVVDERIIHRVQNMEMMNQIQRDSAVRLFSALSAQNEDAKLRNIKLLEDLDQVSVNASVNNKKLSKSNSRLTDLKFAYAKQMESNIPVQRRAQNFKLEEKVKQLKLEKIQSVNRREKLKQELVNEAKVREELERQRRELLLSLALEHGDVMESRANSAVLAEEARLVDQAILHKVETASHDLRLFVEESIHHKQNAFRLHNEIPYRAPITAEADLLSSLFSQPVAPLAIGPAAHKSTPSSGQFGNSQTLQTCVEQMQPSEDRTDPPASSVRTMSPATSPSVMTTIDSAPPSGLLATSPLPSPGLVPRTAESHTTAEHLATTIVDVTEPPETRQAQPGHDSDHDHPKSDSTAVDAQLGGDRIAAQSAASHHGPVVEERAVDPPPQQPVSARSSSPLSGSRSLEVSAEDLAQQLADSADCIAALLALYSAIEQRLEFAGSVQNVYSHQALVAVSTEPDKYALISRCFREKCDKTADALELSEEVMGLTVMSAVQAQSRGLVPM